MKLNINGNEIILEPTLCSVKNAEQPNTAYATIKLSTNKPLNPYEAEKVAQYIEGRLDNG